MPKVDEIITVLKADDNEALEAIRKLDSTAKEARKSLEETKDVFVDIKDEVTEPIDVEVDIKPEEFGQEDQQEIPVKIVIDKEESEDEVNPIVDLDLDDIDIEKMISSEIANKLSIETTEELNLKQELPDEEEGIPYKEGPEELINEGRVELLGEERFDLDKLDEIGSGYSRNVYDLDDDKVLKVIKDMNSFQMEDIDSLLDHFVQNLTEGSHEALPEVLETGLDYVVTEKAQTDYDALKEIVEPITKAVFQAGLQQGPGAFASTQSNKEEAFLEEAAKVDEEHGSSLADMAEKNVTTINYGELIRPDNMGFVKGVPTPIDPGGLAWRDTERYAHENYPGGIEAFKEEVIKGTVERKENLRLKKEDELAEGGDDLDDVIDEDDEIDEADDADLLNPDDYLDAVEEDDEEKGPTGIIDPDEVADSIQAAFASDEKPASQVDEGQELADRISDIISVLSASDFVLDDGKTETITREEVIEFVRSSIKEMTSRS